MTIHNYEPRIKQPRGCADGMGVWEPEPEVQKVYGWRRVLFYLAAFVLLPTVVYGVLVWLLMWVMA